MIIHIEQYDIDEGIKGNCGLCPGALAVNRVLVGDWFCQVFYGAIQFMSRFHYDWLLDTTVQKIRTPWDLCTLARRFDAGLEVKPISFELEIPESMVKRESWLKSKPVLSCEEAKEFCDIIYNPERIDPMQPRRVAW